MGLAEFKQGHFEAAIPPLRAALSASPNNLQAATLLGLSCYGAKRFAEASKYLAVAAASDAANTELHQTLAQSCLLAKDYPCALREFRKLQQLNPNSWAVDKFTGEAMDGEGNTAAAIVEFQKAISLAPRQPELHFALGYLFWKAQRFDDAVAAFNAELTIVPGNPQALAYLGDIAMQKGDYAKALPLLRRAAQLQKGNRLAYLDTGSILMDQKKFPEALSALRRAVELDPNQTDAHFRIGRIDQLMGNTAAAEKEFAKVRELREKQTQELAAKAQKHLVTGSQ
ncbi:MAG: tetratricopeptide repeat protein [Candidatus Acidiferrales bacterium]